MKLRFILDFDGVLFDSASEAFSVCNQYAKVNPALRQDVTYDEFLAYRSVVTDAWQYNRLYNPARQLGNVVDLRTTRPDADDWAFSSAFFAARESIMADADWPEIMSPYDFFFLVRPLLARYPANFAILSTRNVASIKSTMRYFSADFVDIFGQEDIRRDGSKVAVAERAGWLRQDDCFSVYVDDMSDHLKPFREKAHLPLHAGWGYDTQKAGSMSASQIFMIVDSLIKLNQTQPSGSLS
jgi:hypothetical protein